MDKAKVLEIIKANTERILFFPWNGTPVPVKIRMLNKTQIDSCGDFSLLSDRLASEDASPLEFSDLITIKNIQEKLLERSIVEPTFKEILNVAGASDLVTSIREQLSIHKATLKTKGNPKDKEYREIEAEIDSLELYLGFLLPDDFMASITEYILQLNNTDINLVSQDMLLESAFLAKRGNDNPSDHIDGIFTEHQKSDINKTAWIIYDRFLEQEKIKKETTNNWVRGKSKHRR